MGAGWLGTIFINWVIKNSRVKQDAVMGVVLSGFFGFGLILLSMLQNEPSANKAGLTKFLFGNAATVLRSDIEVMAVFAFISILILVLFWKEFKLSTFDPDFLISLGYPIKVLDTLLLSIVVIAITIGLQSIGVVLMSALLVAPAAAARQWTDRLGVMSILAAFIGIFSCSLGAIISSMIPQMPTGPLIVIIVTIIVFLSIFFAGKRGIFWRWLRRFRNRGEIALSRLLENIYLIGRDHEKDYFHEISLFQTLFQEKIDKYLLVLANRGLVSLTDNNSRVCLTQAGFDEAERFFSQTGKGLEE
jgi:manganese/zinc/iron transport system permease protein